MPYTTIHWIKLEKRLLNDHRFIILSEPSQLIYLKLLMLAGETFNKIPKKTEILRLLFRTTLDDTEIRNCLKEIKLSFPKFKENKHYLYFEEWEKRHNWVTPGNSQGVPKDVPEEDKNKIREDKNIIKESSALQTVIDFYFSLTDNNKDKNWVKANYPRHCPAAKDLLALGTPEEVKFMINKGKAYFEDKGLDWKLETIQKHWNKIKAYQEEGEEWI